MKSILFASLALLGLSAAAAPECSGEMMVPNYSCINPKAGSDIRLYIMEFQTCKNGKIVELDRRVDMMNFSLTGDAIDGTDLEIQYQDKRSYYDRARRVDDLTFLMPVSAQATFGTKRVEMTITNKLRPMYEGDQSYHLPGSFKIISAAGKVVESGKLSCFLGH